jgi:GAF domain-containing protein
MNDLEQTIEQQRRHIALLHHLTDATAAMSAASTPDDVATAMLTAGLKALGADAGFLAVLAEDGETLRVSRFAGYDAIPVQQLELSLAANLPIAHAVRMRTAVFIGSNDQLTCDHSGLDRLDPADHACASVPLLGDEDAPALGAINVRFDTPREFTAMDERMLSMLGERCSQAMVRAQRYTDERRRRVAAEEALATSRALEINDDVVQLLAEAKLALELGMIDQAAAPLDRALAATKRMVSSMVTDTVHYRRDALDLDGVLRVGSNTSEPG